jgi:hypothetical protein
LHDTKIVVAASSAEVVIVRPTCREMMLTLRSKAQLGREKQSKRRKGKPRIEEGLKAAIVRREEADHNKGESLVIGCGSEILTTA